MKLDKPPVLKYTQTPFQSNDRRFKQDAHSYTKVSGSGTKIGPGSYETPNLLIKKSFNITVGGTKKKKKRRKSAHIINNHYAGDIERMKSTGSCVIEFHGQNDVGDNDEM